MQPTPTLLQDPLLSTQQLSRVIDVKPRTLERWRLLRKGPDFVRINTRLVRYPLSEVESWLRACGIVEQMEAARASGKARAA
jgi:predicted DNA-binding transcriptional regulator AlpA